MTNGDSIPTLNLGGAKVEDFRIVDEADIQYMYGGRYCSDEYIQVDGKNGPENMHRVTIELICDDNQFISLIRSSADKGNIHVQLV